MCESWCGWCTGSSDRCAERSQCASPCCPSSSAAPPTPGPKDTVPNLISQRGSHSPHVTSSFFTRWWAQILSDSQVSQILRMSPDKKCRAQKKVHHMHSLHTYIHITNTHTHAHTHYTHSTHTTNTYAHHKYATITPHSHHSLHTHTTHTHDTTRTLTHYITHSKHTFVPAMKNFKASDAVSDSQERRISCHILNVPTWCQGRNTLPYEQSAISLP